MPETINGDSDAVSTRKFGPNNESGIDYKNGDDIHFDYANTNDTRKDESSLTNTELELAPSTKGKKKKNKKKKSKVKAANDLDGASVTGVTNVSLTNPDEDYPESRVIKQAPDGSVVVERIDDVENDKITHHRQLGNPVEEIWFLASTPEERKALREFWMSLDNNTKHEISRLSKLDLLSILRTSPKHYPKNLTKDRQERDMHTFTSQNCTCTNCGRKRMLVIEELEKLYDEHINEICHFIDNITDLNNIVNLPGLLFSNFPSSIKLNDPVVEEIPNPVKNGDLPVDNVLQNFSGNFENMLNLLHLDTFNKLPQEKQDLALNEFRLIRPFLQEIVRSDEIGSEQAKSHLLQIDKFLATNGKTDDELNLFVKSMARLTDDIFQNEGDGFIKMVESLTNVRNSREDLLESVKQSHEQMKRDAIEFKRKSELHKIGNKVDSTGNDAFTHSVKNHEDHDVITSYPNNKEDSGNDGKALNGGEGLQNGFNANQEYGKEQEEDGEEEEGEEEDEDDYEENEDDAEDEDEEEYDDYEDELEVDEALSDDDSSISGEEKVEELRHLFLMQVVRVFRQRLKNEFKEKLSRDRTQLLIAELEAEENAKKEKELKKLKQKEKAKEKKRLQQLAKEEEKKKKEDELKAKEEEKKRKEEELKIEQRRRKEELQRKKEEEKLKRIEEQQKKLALQREQEEKRKQEEAKRQQEELKRKEEAARAEKERQEHLEQQKQLRIAEERVQQQQQEQRRKEEERRKLQEAETREKEEASRRAEFLKRKAEQDSKKEEIELEYIEKENLEQQRIAAEREAEILLRDAQLETTHATSNSSTVNPLLQDLYNATAKNSNHSSLDTQWGGRSYSNVSPPQKPQPFQQQPHLPGFGSLNQFLDPFTDFNTTQSTSNPPPPGLGPVATGSPQLANTTTMPPGLSNNLSNSNLGSLGSVWSPPPPTSRNNSIWNNTAGSIWNNHNQSPLNPPNQTVSADSIQHGAYHAFHSLKNSNQLEYGSSKSFTLFQTTKTVLALPTLNFNQFLAAITNSSPILNYKFELTYDDYGTVSYIKVVDKVSSPLPIPPSLNFNVTPNLGPFVADNSLPHQTSTPPNVGIGLNPINLNNHNAFSNPQAKGVWN